MSVPASVFHVANDGNDSWTGLLPSPNPEGTDGPFATLERARDAVRERRPAAGAEVRIAGGVYERQAPFELKAEDSGTGDAPIRYRAAEGAEVRIAGGRRLSWEPVEDVDIRERLDPIARNHVVQADLRAHGITDFGRPSGGGLELFFDDVPMTVARWPNEGFVRIAGLAGGDPFVVHHAQGDRIGKFVYEGDRPARWQDETDPWLHGYWFWDWAEERHRVESIDTKERIISVEPPYHGYGYRLGQWFYAFNLLSELDQPGEWYIDRDSGILYFWPPSPVEEGVAYVSVIDTLLCLRDVEHVEFHGLTFEACRQTAVEMEGGRHNRIVGCTLRNTGAWAVRISDGENNGVAGCDITLTAEGGIHLTGGDRYTLTPCGHFADNNHIHHYSRWKRVYQPAISMNGVGVRATHNLIHDAPHMAIGFGGNDHLIEFNEIHSVCYESNDAGAIYTGRDWTMRGTAIRHNYLHDISGFEGRGCMGVYLDDMFCETDIVGNLFYRVTRAAMIGGGRDCTVVNNLFVDCDPALHIDARAMGWAGYHVDTTMKERLDAMPYRSAPWAERYPKLLTLWEDEPAAPKGNVVARNVFYLGNWDGVRDEARPFVEFDSNLIDINPHFVGTPPEDFRLLEGSPAFALGFEPIPTDRIGLYKSAERASWPVSHTVREGPE